MANVEGNEIALRSVLGQNLPAPRDGSDARTDNDNRPPFFTSIYTVQPTISENLSPGWVYGLTYEGSGPPNAAYEPFVEQDYGPIFVSFGNKTEPGVGQAESILYAGQTMKFPRGARRIFVRSSNNQTAPIRLTWQLDPYADKHTSASVLNQTQAWEGLGFAPTIYDVAQLPVYVYPRTQLVVNIQNNTLVTVNYSLDWNPFGTGALQIDRELGIPAGAGLFFFYGPGVSTPVPIPAQQRAHPISFPGPSMQITAIPTAPIGVGENVKIGVWYR